VVGFFDDIGAAYAWADFAITCAGAGTLAELATVGLKALVIPLAAAALDHQTANARAYAAVTGTPWVAERAVDVERLAEELATRATKPEVRGPAAGGPPGSDAAAAVVEACERLLETWRARRIERGSLRP
jgi:UDP-N-acetylglucosamine--N-acetylmuramyl-(pentapeptide) pyrophosphoryl-undecaprenol N-acetylglucosamine transferase